MKRDNELTWIVILASWLSHLPVVELDIKANFFLLAQVS